MEFMGFDDAFDAMNRFHLAQSVFGRLRSLDRVVSALEGSLNPGSNLKPGKSNRHRSDSSRKLTLHLSLVQGIVEHGAQSSSGLNGLR